MRNDQVTLGNSEQTPKFHEEQPGSWYNYEPSEIALDAQEFDRWLRQLDEELTTPPRD